ncbi:MAG: hypothetical protein JWQ29_2230 [Phenylobacterium sp.]|nr:hypothetical protein [Phenylobacterium sp.]
MQRSRRLWPWLAAASVIGALGILAGSAMGDPAGGRHQGALRRLTQDQYRNSIADIFGADIKIAGRFEQERRSSGLLAIDSTAGSYSPSGYEQYEQMGRSIAAQVVDKDHRATLIPCEPKAAAKPDEACAAAFLGPAGRLLFRRPLAASEVKAYAAFAGATTTRLGDFYAGLQGALARMLVSPEFLFRIETARGGPSGPMQLDGYGKASRLSFLMWNTTPDDELLRAAAAGELETKDGLARQVDRLMASPRLATGVRAFFSDAAGFDGFDSLSKDVVIYPRFDAAVAADAREETLRLVVDHLITRRADYRDLYTTRRGFLTRKLGLIYNVPVQNRYGWTEYEFAKEDNRDGILSRMSFLALHGHPGRSSPTLRGKAIRELVLCQEVPAPPANVNFALVQDVKNPAFRTARARLGRHNDDPVCASCHKMMDPLGLPLETFDSSGEFRATENGAAIETSGQLDSHKFADAAGLGQAIHDDPQTASCLVERTYGYALGRAPAKADEAFLDALDSGFAKDGYRYPDLLRRIALSEEFYTLSPDPGPATKTASQAGAKRTGG